MVQVISFNGLMLLASELILRRDMGLVQDLSWGQSKITPRATTEGTSATQWLQNPKSDDLFLANNAISCIIFFSFRLLSSHITWVQV